MTDLEKELVEKLVSAITNNNKDLSFDHLQIRQELHEYGIALIRSHTQALVAAAYAVCAKRIRNYRFLCEENERRYSLARRIFSQDIDELTPADAVRELERRDESVRADTIMRFRKVLDRLDIHGYYNEMQSEFGCEEASLSKPAPERCGAPAAPFIPRWGMAFSCVLPKGHSGEHRQGGTCLKHGEYIGAKCPHFPDCMPAPVERSNENG